MFDQGAITAGLFIAPGRPAGYLSNCSQGGVAYRDFPWLKDKPAILHAKKPNVTHFLTQWMLIEFTVGTKFFSRPNVSKAD